MRAVLARPDFRLLFVAVVATMVGESALLLVLAIWVKALTGSSSLAGATLFALALPSLAAPVLGWVVDRFRRRPFLIVTLLTTAVALLPLLLVRGRDDIWIIFAVAVCLGTSMIMASATTAGLIKEMLPDELLADANGALQTVRQGLRLVAPIGGAALFGLLGGRAVAALDILCLLIGAAPWPPSRSARSDPSAASCTGWARWWPGCAISSVRPRCAGPRSGWPGLLGHRLHRDADLRIRRSRPAPGTGLHQPDRLRPGRRRSVRWADRGPGRTGAGRAGHDGDRGAADGGRVRRIRLSEHDHRFAGAVLAGAGIPLTLVGFNTLLIRTTPHALMGRVNAAAEAIISTPQSLSIAGGAALALVVDYRLLFVIMGAIMVGSAWYLWVGRGLTPHTPAVVPAEAIPAQGEGVRLEQPTTP